MKREIDHSLDWMPRDPWHPRRLYWQPSRETEPEDWTLRFTDTFEQDTGCRAFLLFQGNQRIAHLAANILTGTVENMKTEEGHRRGGHCLRLHRHAHRVMLRTHGVGLVSDPPNRRSADCEQFYQAQVQAGRARYDQDRGIYVWTELPNRGPDANEDDRGV